MEMSMNITSLWNVTPCSLVELLLTVLRDVVPPSSRFKREDRCTIYSYERSVNFYQTARDQKTVIVISS